MSLANLDTARRSTTRAVNALHDTLREYLWLRDITARIECAPDSWGAWALEDRRRELARALGWEE